MQQVLLDQTVVMVLPETKGQQVQQVQQDLQVHKGQKEQQVHKDQQVVLVLVLLWKGK